MSNSASSDLPEIGRARLLPHLPRRTLLMLGMGLLAGCATTPVRRVTRLPSPLWPDDSLLAAAPTVVTPPPAPLPPAPPMTGVIPRSSWTSGTPDTRNIDPMLPVRWVTVHHDGMTAFTATDMAACTGRLELIRNGHRGKGWADIGYHYVIDRAGRVWEGRDIRYQGAHVKDNNEGNVGILMVGNFDLHTPSMAQLAALDRHLRVCMKKYGLRSTQVRSHQEWSSARTACPGRHMQSKMNGIRRALA